MRRRFWLAFVICSFVTLSACASEETPASTADSTAPATTAPAGDALSGTWTGDWGPTPTHRNPVTLDLAWDGTNLTGTVNPGPDAVPLTKASYAPDTGMVMMEAMATGHSGEMVHFMIDGKLADGTMMGSWVHDDKKGDFKITKN